MLYRTKHFITRRKPNSIIDGPQCLFLHIFSDIITVIYSCGINQYPHMPVIRARVESGSTQPEVKGLNSAVNCAKSEALRLEYSTINFFYIDRVTYAN